MTHEIVKYCSAALATVFATIVALGAPVSSAQEALLVDVGDPAAGVRAYPSVERIDDPGFRLFVSKVVAEATALSGAKAIKFGASTGGAGAQLVFVRSPLVAPKGQAVGAPPPPVEQGDACRVTTPWFHMVVPRGPDPAVRGVFHWNERQILRDEVLLAGGSIDADVSPDPVSQDQFDAWAQNYARAEITDASGGGRPTALTPPEVLWLFRQAPQSTFGPFSEAAAETLSNVSEKSAQRYADLARGLISKCQSGSEKTIDVPSISVALSLLAKKS